MFKNNPNDAIIIQLKFLGPFSETFVTAAYDTSIKACSKGTGHVSLLVSVYQQFRSTNILQSFTGHSSDDND